MRTLVKRGRAPVLTPREEIVRQLVAHAILAHHVHRDCHRSVRRARVRLTVHPELDRQKVPRVGVLVKPATGRLAFYRHLRLKSGDTVSPYDLRRSYAEWLDLARIPQFRQDYYMAHGHGT